MRLKNTLLATALLLSVTTAQAALVETDWNNAGDGLATLDTDTGIEWLDLTQTLGLTINQTEGLLSSTFDGWRLPTRAEVTQMMVIALPSQAAWVEASLLQPNGSYQSLTDPTVGSEVNNFIAFFGATYDWASATGSVGMVKNDPGQAFSVIHSGVQDRHSDGAKRLWSNDDLVNDYDWYASSFGVYLVSDGGTTLSSQLDPSLNSNNANAPTTDVSSPALLGLIGLGLLGFASRRRPSVTLNKK